MKKIITCVLTILGLTSACGQKNYEDRDVQGFSKLLAQPDVIILDVRTAKEFAEGYIEGAVNIDQSLSNFIAKVKAALPTDKTIAVYCRSGRRSASAAARLAAEGLKVVNLKGGIMAWNAANMPVTTGSSDLSDSQSKSYEVDAFKTKSGKTIKFHALIHASIRIEYDGREMMVDPVTQLGNKTIDYTAMPKADYILVTHEHGDHFDQAAIAQLSAGDTRLITNLRCTERLRTDDGASGTRLGYVEVMGNGDTMTLSDDITVEAVPAYNITEGHTQFHPKGRDNGFILTIDGLRIYIAGDTEDIPEMADIKDIDIAFMPCNQPYTMTPEQLIKAAKTVKPKVLFPYHYGQTDVSSIPSELKGCGIDVRIRHYE